MAGIILILMGLFKFSNVIKYIPSSIINGFNSGIAVVIFSTQIKDLLGLKISEVPSQFFSKIISYITHLNTINIKSLLIALLTIAIILLWPKINKKNTRDLNNCYYCHFGKHVLKFKYKHHRQPISFLKILPACF